MQVQVDFSLIPLGVGVSLSDYIAECQRVLASAGLSHQLHPFGTVIEGDWDAVMAAVKVCHQRIHAMGAPRITSTVKIATRTDRDQGMMDKVDAVASRLREQPESPHS